MYCDERERRRGLHRGEHLDDAVAQARLGRLQPRKHRLRTQRHGRRHQPVEHVERREANVAIGTEVGHGSVRVTRDRGDVLKLRELLERMAHLC